MRIRFCLTALAIVAFAPALMGASWDDPDRLISVSGTSTIKIAPDVVVWNLSTRDDGMNLGEAKAASDEKLRTILAAVRELGVADEDVQTGHLSIERMYQRDNYGNQGEFKGFAVRRTIGVRQRDVGRFDEFLTRFVAGGDIEANFHFETSKLEELRWDARLEALAIAEKKADAMARTVGAKLGKAITIEENPRPQPLPYQRGMLANTSFFAEGIGGDPVVAAGGTFAPGLIEITETVHAQFELR